MKKRAERLSALILIFVMLFSIISFSDFAEAKSSTGHLQIASTGQEAGALQATANIVLKENENIPAWTLVKVQVGPYEKTFPLFEAVNLMYIPNLQYKYDNVYLEGLAKKDLGLKEPEAVYGFNSGDEEVVQVFSRFTTTKLNAPTSKISEEYLTSMFPAEYINSPAEYINSIQTLNDLLPDDDTDGDGIPDSQDDDDDGDGIPDDKDGGFSPSPVGDGFGELVNSCPLPCDKYCGNGICDVCDCICMCYDNDNCNCECNNDGVCDSWEDQENCADCGECQTDEDCEEGEECIEGKCVWSGKFECQTDEDCENGEKCCSNSCSDLNSDENNCGSCGTQCEANEGCIDGFCTKNVQCGNKVCESGECETCPADCEPLDENCVCICGNDVCESRYSDPLDPGSGYGEIIIQPGSSGSAGSSGSGSSGQQGQGYDCDETCKSCEEDCGACQCSCGDGYCNRDKGCEETSCNPEDNNEGKNCCNSDCVGELPTTVVTPGGVVNLMGVSPGLGKSYGDNEYSQYMGISGRGMPSLPNTKYNYITALSNIINVKSFAKGEIPTVFEFLASKPNGFTFDGQNIININTGERIAVRNLNEQIPRELQASATEVILNNYLTTGSIQGIQPTERLIGVESPIDQVARAYLAAKAGFKDADNYASLNNEVVSLGDVESSVDITTTGYTYTLNGQEITVATLAEIPSEYREEVAAVISVVAEIRTETPEGTTVVTTTETTGTTETTPTTTTTTTETTGGETTGGTEGTEGGTTTGDTGGTTTGGDTGGGDRGGDTGAPTASIIKGTYREVTSFKETYKLGRQIVTEDLTANKKLYTTTQTYMKPTIIYVYPQLVPMLDINKVPKYTKTSRSEYLPDYYINLYADKNKNSILSATGYAGESTGENGKETHVIPIDLSLLGINLEQDGVYKMKVSLIFGNDVIDVQEKSIRVGDSPKKIGLKACSPNWICGDYDVCTPEYNFKGLSSADEIHYMIGVQRQYCYDSAGCTADEKVNERECIVKMNIETNVIEAEGRAYIEVYDADDNLLKVKMAVPGIGNNVVSLDLTPVGRISQFQK